MEQRFTENLYHGHDIERYRQDNEIARAESAFVHTPALQRLHRRGLAALGGLLVRWGNRLQQRYEALASANGLSEGNPC